jgi:hypothetical protein
MSFWLTTKLNEKCACGSGKAYRNCCMRWEIIGFVIVILATLVSFFVRVNGVVILVAVLIFAGFVGWLAKQFLKRKK